MPDFDYANEFGVTYHRARQLPEAAQQWIAKVRAQKIRRWISPQDRVFEYGVGFGWNLAAIECREKVGFDVAPDLRSSVEAKGIRFETNEEALKGRDFDVLLAHHVLEHVPTPTAILKRWKSLLRASGRLLLFVPFEREGKYLRFRSNDRAHHLYSWTPRSLARLMAISDWKLDQLEAQPFRFDRLAAIINVRLGGGFRLYQLLRRAGLLLLPEYEICVVAH